MLDKGSRETCNPLCSQKIHKCSDIEVSLKELIAFTSLNDTNNSRTFQKRAVILLPPHQRVDASSV